MSGLLPALRQVPAEPHQFWRLHFRRHDAADKIEHFMTGRRAFFRFSKRAMIEPDDRVPAVLSRTRDAQLHAITVADNERTCRIKADPGNSVSGRTGGGNRILYSGAYGCPDLFGIIFGMIGFGPMHLNGI